MSNATTHATSEKIPSVTKKIDDLYALIDGIEDAMMTTRSAGGELVSRPMATQAHRPGVDLWFMTRTDTGKVLEISESSEVNLAYFKSGEWVSVSGTGTLSKDRQRIHELYRADWKLWLEDLGGEMNGGPDDPRIVLIEVRAKHVSYFKRTQSRPVMMFNLLKSLVTGELPDLGETRHLGPGELRASSR